MNFGNQISINPKRTKKNWNNQQTKSTKTEFVFMKLCLVIEKITKAKRNMVKSYNYIYI